MATNDSDAPLVNSRAGLHERELAARQQRSQVVSTVESLADTATLYYDPTQDRFFFENSLEGLWWNLPV